MEPKPGGGNLKPSKLVGQGFSPIEMGSRSQRCTEQSGLGCGVPMRGPPLHNPFYTEMALCQCNPSSHEGLNCKSTSSRDCFCKKVKDSNVLGTGINIENTHSRF